MMSRRQEYIPLSVNKTTKIERSRINKYQKKLAAKLLNLPQPLTKIDKQSLNIRRLLKKSFFKKTTSLTLQPVIFPYYTPHILPGIKTIRFDRPDTFRSFKSSPKKQSILLAKCKHLNTLITTSQFTLCYLKSIRTLRELRHLEIGVLDTEIMQVSDMFKHLIQLKYIKLMISREPSKLTQIPQPHTISRFFQHLTNLKNLQKLKLQIGESLVSENEEILQELLANLGNSNIKEMNIELHLQNSLNLTKNPSEGMQKFLGKLESLGAYQAPDMSINSNLGKKPSPSLKSLTLVYIGSNHQEIDLKAYLDFCPSLKDLWIHCSTQSVFISENTVISKELKAFSIRSFIPSKQARIETTLNSLVGSKLRVLDIQLADLDSVLARRIAEVNRALDPQEMNSFSLRTEFWIGGKNKEELKKLLSSNSISQLVQSLVPFKNLERLELHIKPQDQNFTKHIEYLFDSLPQLKRMDLDLKSANPELNNFKERISFYFAIEKMPGLDFIRVKLPPAIWIENPEGLFEKIAGLKNIQHLELDLYHLVNLPQESILKIISTFENMKTFDTLKIVHIPNLELQREFNLMIDNKSSS